VPAHLGLLLLAAAPRAEITPLSFADAVREADRIVYAEVVRIHDVPSERRDEDDEQGPIRVAELRVEDTLKGPRTSEPVLVLASPTWSCDATNVRLDEHGLFFLATPTSWEQQKPSWHRACALEFPAWSVEVIVGSGQGEILEKTHDGRVLLWSAIELPSDVPRLRLHECELFERAVIELLVQDTLEMQRRPLLTAELLAPMRADGWRLYLRRDRTGELTAGETPRMVVLESLRSLEHHLLKARPPKTGCTFVLPGDRDETVRLVLHARDRNRELLLHFRRDASAAGDPDTTYVDDVWNALASELRDLETVSDSIRIPGSAGRKPRR
jgi:hypothetical protein